jgi:C-terminal processing protease CtpA/Prc
MPDGAYVVEVAPDGAGRRAGLTPGMVIARVNGISLVGMGAAMSKILGSEAASLDVETVTGGHVIIEQPR